MKRYVRKTFTFLLAVLLCIPFFSLQNAETASAKWKKDTNVKPIISECNKTLDGCGVSFELSLKNLSRSVFNINWYSQNDKIATIKNTDDPDKVIVTSVSKGTTYVKCMITFRNGSTWNVSCKITVKANTNAEINYVPQAKLVSLVHIDNNRLLATFDRSIQTPGLVLVNNKTECIEGIKDSTDGTKVYYPLSTVSALLTGSQKVYVGYWEGYDVSPKDTSSDKFMEVNINFANSAYPVLPAPYSIEQNETDHNILYVRFYNNLDEGTAENISNYSINGNAVKSAELTNASNGVAVKLTLQAGTLKTTGNYVVSISGIKGYNNTYSTMKSYQVTLRLTENVPPTLTSFYYTYPSTVVLAFSENITGTIDFKAIQGNENIVSYVYINGNQIVLNLTKTPVMGETLQIIPTEHNSIKDLAGNLTTSILTRNLVPSGN
jgi:hypothetical protein